MANFSAPSYRFRISEQALRNATHENELSSAKDAVLSALVQTMLKRYPSFTRIHEQSGFINKDCLPLLQNSLVLITSVTDRKDLIIELLPRHLNSYDDPKRMYQRRWIDTYSTAIQNCLSLFLENTLVTTEYTPPRKVVTVC